MILVMKSVDFEYCDHDDLIHPDHDYGYDMGNADDWTHDELPHCNHDHDNDNGKYNADDVTSHDYHDMTHKSLTHLLISLIMMI